MNRDDDNESMEPVDEDNMQSSHSIGGVMHSNSSPNPNPLPDSRQREYVVLKRRNGNELEIKADMTDNVKNYGEFYDFIHNDEMLYSKGVLKEIYKGYEPEEIEIRYKELEKDIKGERVEYEGLWKQDEYKITTYKIRYQRYDGSIFTTEGEKKEFVKKLPEPVYPTIPFDCVVKNVYTNKYHSIHNYYNDVPLSKGDRIPKQLDQGHGWVFFIGYSFPTWDCNRTGPDRTTYYSSWDPAITIETDHGPITLTW